MSSEIGVASEFVCLSFTVWGGAQASEAAAALALEDNQ